jgi:hypothetical protein
MSLSASRSEIELRNKFDFSKTTRGQYADRFRKGHTVVVLEGDSGEPDPLEPDREDSQLTEIAGRHLLIAHLLSAGFEVAQPLRDNGIDLVAYQGKRGTRQFLARPIQLKAFSRESFYVDKRYESLPHLLIAYVWNVRTPDKSEIYALTFPDALAILEKKGFADTNSWTKAGQYFVRNAGKELKNLLKPFRMTPDRWEEKLKAA